MQSKPHFRVLSTVIILILIIHCFPMIVLAATYEELLNEPNNENGFIDSVIIREVNSDFELPGFSFDISQNRYTISIPASSNYDFFISVENIEKNYWYRWKTANGEWSGQIKTQSTNISYGSRKVDTGETCDCFLSVGLKYDSNQNGVIDEYDDFYEWDTYVFTVFSAPSIALFSVNDSNNQSLTLNPSFHSIPGDYYVATKGNSVTINAYNEFSTLGGTNNVSKVELADGTTSPGMAMPSFDGSGNTTWMLFPNQLSNVNVSLDDSAKVTWTDDTKKLAKIPIIASYVNSTGDTITSTYNLYVAVVDSFPDIYSVSPDVTITKLEETVLSVESSYPDDATDIQYRWTGKYTGESETNGSSFIPPSDKAGVFEYTCVMSCKLAGVEVKVESNPITVTVQLGDVNSPVVLKALGYTNPSLAEDDVQQQVYETEYSVGTSPYPLTIQLEEAEQGTEHTLYLYYNSVESTQGGKQLNSSTLSKSHGNVISDGNTIPYRWWQITPEESLPEGTWYLYAVITATEDGNPDNSASTVSNFIEVHYTTKTLDFDGSGTEDEPYLISSLEDLVRLRTLVAGGDRLNGIWFRMESDLSLPADWTPIGADTPFGGCFDGGGHTLTVASGGKPLFARVSEALIQNLNIYGERIDGCGLVDESYLDYGPDGNYWTGVPEAMTLRNIHLLRGSSTRRSGLVEGSGSGANTVRIYDCVVDAGVIVGYTTEEQDVGSFIGVLNGYVQNCVSCADVYGSYAVGGIVGRKGQAVGACSITNCAFLGKVTGGAPVGGIIGEGYVSESAPNTPVISVNNCYVAADLSGTNKVGGILGAESGVVDIWDEYALSNNSFYGTITTTITDESLAENNTQRYQGGIIGYYNGFNKKSAAAIKDNYFYEASGAVTSAIGGYGSYVLASSSAERGFADAAEFEAFYSSIGFDKTTDEFADGTVLALLNNGENSLKNWEQGEKYPKTNGDPIPSFLTLSGQYATEYYVGDELDTNGMVFTLTYSDGTTKTVSAGELSFSGFDSSKQGECTVVAAFGAVSASFKVTILKKDAEGITVYFTLLGDDLHNSDEDGVVHTLAAGNLQTWITKTAYTLDGNATVLDLIREALGQNNITVTVKEKTALGTAYIPSITRNGVTIGEFDNGPNSGWMYTINGKGSNNGVAQQFLSDGDEIVFHYTDDYTKEDYSMGWTGEIDNQSGSAAKVTVADAKTGTVTVDCALACAVIGQKADGSYALLPASVSGNTVTFDASAYTKVIVRIKGDITGDGKVDSSDTLLMKQLVAGIKEPDAITALLLDITGDGKINSSDTLKMKRVAAGLDSLAW